MRWSLKIQDFQPCIIHCPGRLNNVADALSRNTVGESEEEEIKEVMYPPLNSPLLTLITSSISSITLERIKHEQSGDDELRYLKADLPPNYEIYDGIVYKLSKTGIKLPVIPLSLRKEILSYFHELPHSGHGGFRKTFNRLSRRIFWKGMREDTFNFLQSCQTCQLCKNPSSKPQGNLQSNKVHGPWDMLALDLMGPLPRTKNGKTMLLVVVDHFTKWVELLH
jgi:hypothetical protein